MNNLCLLELIDLLMSGNNYFYPNHPDFQYQRIGIKKIIKTDYPEFIPDNVAIAFEDLTWHSSRINLSIFAKIPGTIINEGMKQLTYVYRNFTIIKDGSLNLNLLPCQLDATLYNLLSIHYPKIIINPNTYISVLDFSLLDIINDRICPNPKAAVLADNVMKKLQLDCHMKVLRYYREKDKNIIKKDGSYCPPTMIDCTQHKFYMAKEFNIKVAGCCVLPKVIDLDKKNGIVVEFMKEVTDVSDKVYEYTKKELYKINYEIQKYKFYMILCNKWFDNLINNNSIIFNGMVGTVNVNTTITFTIKEVKVEYD